MSLQKIQVELEVIRSMGSEEGQSLSKKVWDGFKAWRNEPKYEKVKKQKAVKKLETLEDQAKPVQEPAQDQSNRPLLGVEEESLDVDIPNSMAVVVESETEVK